jgi:hypothetical protein
MMHGRNNGKKVMAVRIVKHAFDIISLLTDQNPIQVVVDAIINRCENNALEISEKAAGPICGGVSPILHLSLALLASLPLAAPL